MGMKMLEIGAQMRNFMIFFLRAAYKSACNHPFLGVFVFFLIFLYRSFPSVFFLLLSASPVLVSTAVLLGTLLSFGQLNLPEIEKVDESDHKIASLKAGISVNASVVERDESFTVERYTGREKDVIDKSIEESCSPVDLVEADDEEGDLIINEPLINENLQEVELRKAVIEEAGRELHNSEFEIKSETNWVVLENYCSTVGTEKVESTYKESHVESIDPGLAESTNASHGSQLKRVEDEEKNVDDESSDTESDGDESASPDASMADIIPVLDELHPLLDEDAPHPAHKSYEGSSSASDLSRKSNDGIDESDEDDISPAEEFGDEDHDEEEEGEAQVSKEEETKSVITWTEDDQKNLMDLGTSELERNQRLENVIARRRWQRLMAEKNLIDLESADVPCNVAPTSDVPHSVAPTFDVPHSVAPILITRHNPFDLPYDVNENTGLPPIPGSAPSLLLPRNNPFDLPYQCNEEKSELVGDSSQQEFSTFPPKEISFRRHESFSVGPSFFGSSNREKQDIQLKPYFIPERVAFEGTSYSSFQRQSSELSDSKVSSVPESDSICSAEDQDDNKLSDGEYSQEAELISNLEHVEHGSESSEDEDALELGNSENMSFEHEEVEIKFEDVESHPDALSILSETEKTNGCRSSSSSQSEVNPEITDEEEDEVLSSFEPEKKSFVGASEISTQTLPTELHKEPIYDLSPREIQKNLSSSSISSDVQVALSEMGDPPLVVKRTVSFVNRVSDVCDQSMEIDTLINSKPFSNEDLKFADSKEDFPQVVFEQVSGVDCIASSSETKSNVEHSLNKEVVPQIKQDRINASSSDEKFQVSTNQEVNDELLSIGSQTQLLADEKSIYTLEEQLPLSDKSVVALSSDIHEQLLEEPSIIHPESVVEVCATHNLDASNEQLENEVSSSSSDLDPATSHAHERDIIEEADEIKEIDKKLLMELNTVEDLSVQVLGSNSKEIEKTRVACEETNSGMPLVESQSIEHVDSTIDIGEVEIAHQSQNKEENNSEMALLRTQSVGNGISHEGSSLINTETEMPVVEARSVEDINMAIEQIHHVEKHGSPNSDDKRPNVEGSKDQGETNPDLLVERQSNLSANSSDVLSPNMSDGKGKKKKSKKLSRTSSGSSSSSSSSSSGSE